MLPLGRIGIRAERGEARMTRFTRDEQRTLISLWSIAQSPLMFGGDLPGNDEFTLSLISNDEVLAVDQHGSRTAARSRKAATAWCGPPMARGADEKYVAVFNVGDDGPIDIPVQWAALDCRSNACCAICGSARRSARLPVGYTFRVGPHGSGIYKVKAAPKP